MTWQTTRFAIDLARPRVMAIVNVTPDSFSDGGCWPAPAQAMARCEQAVREGRQQRGREHGDGSPPLPLAEELARVLPVVRDAVTLGVPVSVDTYKAEVMRAVLDLGADIVNDIWALRQPGALEAVAAHPSCGVCLMHMHGEPLTMQVAPMAGDAVPQVQAFLQGRSGALQAAGVDAARIAWDPGIGFGKTVAQNFSLLARQGELLASGRPLLVGWSRKSSLGAVTGDAVDDRLTASVAAAVLAVERGARIVRVHDVKETASALKVWSAVVGQSGP